MEKLESNIPAIGDGNVKQGIETATNTVKTLSQEEKEKQAEIELKKFMEELKNEQKNTPSAQLKRLLNTNFVSPYEVLTLGPEATDEEIKRQYRQFSLLVHPDKNQDERASDAFHVLETAYKILLDPEKKKFFQRIIREAKERVELERTKENKNRLIKGQPPLSQDNLEIEIKQTVKKIIDEIEERRLHTEKLENAYKKRHREEEDLRKMQEEYEKHTNKEWESFRDKRVKNWNRFKEKITSGKRRGKYETKPPKSKMEERTDDQHIDIFRPNTII